MNDRIEKPPQSLALAVTAGICIALCIAAFAGWIVQGPEMFLTMAENRLSWCF